MDMKALFESIPHRYPELAGQVALITGGSRGIGKGIALRLAREGMRLAITSRTAAEVHATAAEFRDLGIDVVEHVGDVGQAEQIDALFQAIHAAFGGIDLLVNNAGVMGSPPFWELDEAGFDAVLRTNVKGPFLCTRRAVELMRPRRQGSILYISSVGGLRAHQPGTPY